MVGVRGNYFFTPEIYLTGPSRGRWRRHRLGRGARTWLPLNDTISAIAGYRALGVDYDHGGFIYDIVQQGPILGLSIRF